MIRFDVNQYVNAFEELYIVSMKLLSCADTLFHPNNLES